MKLNLKVWRQNSRGDSGKFIKYVIDDINQHMSFLEMLDVLNEKLIQQDEEPIAFEHDCREGICGSCGFYINGRAHGPMQGTTVCQLHMRFFRDGQTIVIEPWRANAFPVVKDLVVDRSSLDRVLQAGGYVSVGTGGVPDGNALLIPKPDADEAFLGAECIGCGACVATCKNASSNLFLSAKVSHLALLPQGKAEAKKRVKDMVAVADKELFGSCSNTGACEVECPKEISVRHIARMNREYLKATLF